MKESVHAICAHLCSGAPRTRSEHSHDRSRIPSLWVWGSVTVPTNLGKSASLVDRCRALLTSQQPAWRQLVSDQLPLVRPAIYYANSKRLWFPSINAKCSKPPIGATSSHRKSNTADLHAYFAPPGPSIIRAMALCQASSFTAFPHQCAARRTRKHTQLLAVANDCDVLMRGCVALHLEPDDKKSTKVRRLVHKKVYTHSHTGTNQNIFCVINCRSGSDGWHCMHCPM
jgi:hypothetical protein